MYDTILDDDDDVRLPDTIRQYTNSGCSKFRSEKYDQQGRKLAKANLLWLNICKTVKGVTGGYALYSFGTDERILVQSLKSMKLIH